MWGALNLRRKTRVLGIISGDLGKITLLVIGS